MVFPNVTQEAVDSNPIVTMLHNSVKNLELVKNELQVDKIKYTYVHNITGVIPKRGSQNISMTYEWFIGHKNLGTSMLSC